MRETSSSGEDLLQSLRDALRDAEPARVVVLCVGNPARGDDGFGPAVAAELAAAGLARVFDGRTTPENDLPFVAGLEPEVVLFVDAVHFGGGPGELRVLGPQELRSDDISTHGGSLAVAAQFLQGACGARSALLAAQPAHTGQGSELSEEMAAAVGRAAQLVQAALNG